MKREVNILFPPGEGLAARRGVCYDDKKEEIIMNILIVVDMQNDFVSGALGTPEARRIVPAAAERVAAGLSLIHI